MLSRFLKIGNQGSALEDEQSSASFQNAQNFQHFDHAFKGELHTTSGPTFVSQFGECSYANRSVQVICKGTSFDIIEDVGISIRKSVQITYKQITALSWDHANSEVKIEIGDDELVILTMAISVEFEGELKLRLKGMGSGVRLPPTTYIGMFAGATKPKPFQRKRPNLSTLAPSKLPPLHDMRSLAMQLHKGSYKPCPPGESRRMELATQHIYEGFNSFPLLFVRGHSVQNQWRHDSILQIKEEMLVFRPLGANIGNSVEFAFADISDWTAIDNDNHSSGDSGIEIKSNEGDIILFGVAFIRDVKHSLEFCWNNYQVLNGGKVKLGSTHGRPIVTITTLSGEVPSPDAPRGLSEVVDQDGILVRPGARMVPRRSSVVSGVMGSNEPKVVPPENRDVKKHWHKVVMHQGWLLKKGGLGVGSNKSWIKRYFVLYNTSQGHILTYYSDFTECPLYTNERHQRNAVDLAKTTFIRPGSNKSDAVDTPAHCFDIVTTEREWTLCAESQENVQRWLKLLTRAVDEDVAILPDEDLLFKVKPKADHTGVLCLTDYSTTLRVSANGVSVCTPHTNGSQNSSTLSSMTGSNTTEREHFFWVYTDFYKWSLISQVGKLALLVNVFADSSFTLRNEYTFRNKEAIRLASAIEFFIEKFMSVMHIRLETTAGAFDDVVESIAVKRNNNNKEVVSAGLHDGGDFDHSAFEESSFAQPAEELDLLGLDFEEELAPVAPSRSSTGYDNSNNNNNNNSNQYSGYNNNASAQQQQQQQQQLQQQQQQQQQLQQQKQQPSFNDDPFGDDPFSDSTPKNKPSAAAMGSGSASNNVDPFGDEMFRGESAVQVPKSIGYSAVSDPFGDDPFGSSEPAPMSSPKNVPSDSYGGGERSPPVSYAQAFGGDPFGEPEPVERSVMKSGPSGGSYDPFGDAAAVAAPMPIMLGPRVAPSLTLEQLEQHAVWIQGALIAGGGPLYDDGVLQIASKIEVRGSQGRITFYYRSQSALQLSEFEVSIKDSAGLIRCQLSALPSSTLPSAGQTEQQLLVECMQPASPGPQLILTYIDQMLGKRSASIDLPIMVTTFNEPLALSGVNFTARWDQLVTPGQEAQEVLSPPRPVIPQDIHRILTTALKFGHITGLPDESEFVIYGAASLRTGTLTPSGEKVTVGCLAKIEMNVQANAMRITFRTLHPSATAALMATAKIALL